ncbi:MAG: UPF0758 domain-containing protein [Nanoarchaeota archaeon]
MKLLEMPEDSRPRERFQKLGPAALSDAEVLAILLQNGTAKENAVELSNRLLSDYGYITIDRVEKDPANSRPSFKVKLTESGRSFLSRKTKP